MEEFEEKDLFIVNDNTKSRMGFTGQRDSNIDLIFSSGDMLNYIEYSQERDCWNSDHFPIMFKISIGYNTYEKRTNRLSTKKTDWIKYRELIIEREVELEKEDYKNSDIEDRCDRVIRYVKECVKHSRFFPDANKRQEKI